MGRLVVGGFGLWVMAVGGLKCADQWWVGSVPISVFGGGANLCSDMFLSLFFYFGGGFGGGCGLIWWLWSGFFFFPGDCGRNNFAGCCCSCCCGGR